MSRLVKPNQLRVRGTAALLQRRRFLSASLVVPLALSQWGCSRTALTSMRGATMGTYYRISLGQATGTPEFGRAELITLQHKIDTRLIEIERQMSTYDSDSDLNRLAATRLSQPLALGADTLAVLRASIALNAFSRGAFDPTVAPLVDAWGFGPEANEILRPPPHANNTLNNGPIVERQRAAQAVIGMQHMQLQQENATRLAPVRLDLNAIAKGYAVDQVQVLLQRHGISNALVDIGGELRANGKAQPNRTWRVGIQDPNTVAGTYVLVVTLNNEAIATSGDYRQFYLHQGQRYSHTIDPRSRAPVKHATASVTVVSADAMQADAFATALMVMGSNEAARFAEREGIAALFIDRVANGLQTTMSPRFRAHYAS